MLHARFGLPREPFGDFMLEVSHLSQAFSKRRAVLASASGKLSRLCDLGPAFKPADRSIVFSQTKDAARRAINGLGAVGIRGSVLDSSMSSWYRQQVLVDFEEERFDVVAAPKLLDEGIDVPAADLAAILATSRSRRQMIQRMGRVLRHKDDDRIARIVVLFVEDSPEDPKTGSHEDFMDLILPAASDVQRFSSSRDDTVRLIDYLSDHGGRA